MSESLHLKPMRVELLGHLPISSFLQPLTCLARRCCGQAVRLSLATLLYNFAVYCGQSAPFDAETKVQVSASRAWGHKRRQCLVQDSDMETSWFSCRLKPLSPVCFGCGCG